MDAPDDVVLERHDEDEEEEDKEEKDEQKEDEAEEEEEEVVDEDEEEDTDEDDGKEPQTIGQGEVVNTSVEDVNAMVHDWAIVRPGQGQELREHTPQPQPAAAAPRPHTLDPRPRPQSSETHSLSVLEHLGSVTLQKPRTAVRTVREAKAAGHTSDVDVNHQLLIEMAGGNDLRNVPLHDVPLPDVPLPDVPLPEALRDGSVGQN